MSLRPSEEEGLYGWRPNSELSTHRLVCLMIAEKRETLSCATSTWPVRVLLCTNSMSWALCRESNMTQLVWFDHRGSRICTCKWNTAIDWQNDSPYGPFLVRQIHGTLQCTSKKPKMPWTTHLKLFWHVLCDPLATWTGQLQLFCSPIVALVAEVTCLLCYVSVGPVDCARTPFSLPLTGRSTSCGPPITKIRYSNSCVCSC